MLLHVTHHLQTVLDAWNVSCDSPAQASLAAARHEQFQADDWTTRSPADPTYGDTE
jgi:hypothetical protein